jgi:hypothetical protein
MLSPIQLYWLGIVPPSAKAVLVISNAAGGGSVAVGSVVGSSIGSSAFGASVGSAGSGMDVGEGAGPQLQLAAKATRATSKISGIDFFIFLSFIPRLDFFQVAGCKSAVDVNQFGGVIFFFA